MARQTARVERRRARWRRQLNDAFADPTGHIAISKLVAVAGQVVLLWHTARHFDDMIARPETLLVCLAFIIAPDVVKKLISIKYGNGAQK